MSGFQAGLSYTPNSGDRGQTMTRSDVVGFSNIWDLGLAYNTQIDNSWKLGLAGTYEGGESNVAGTEDLNAWNVGANVGFQGFSVAGSYGDWSDSDNTAGRDSDYWTLGGGYTAGPIGLSATYIDSTRDVTATTQNEFQNLVLGAEYKLAAGLTPYAEVSFYEFDSAGVAYDNQGTTVILGTQVAF
jgi:predicted porin